MLPFPEAFDPTVFAGVRARQFLRREDLFQQLVGDGLRELRWGLGVHVSTTRGKDGSIDVFVEPTAADGDHCLPELPKPLIVECKDHDEAGASLRKNLFAAWDGVAETLERQASKGWSGNHLPWRSAHAYVYAVSARLPTAGLRRDLRDRIAAFFAALPNRPPLERVEVLDWSDLRALWERVPRLADRWLGVGLEALLGHAEQVERFTGFRSYLLEANLPFLAPPSDDPAHPAALLARLSEPGRERGLLLEGPGGVGKSRTLVEVAVRADAAGWRVLHVQADEPALADADLEATVLAGSGPTLVVIDYLEKAKLDPARLRRRLLPAAAARGIHLALLANARPATDGPGGTHEELFDVVALRPTVERARAIADLLLATIAPRAIERLGHRRLAELCGIRPIVALFIAGELERRAAAGALDEERLAGVRSGDLTSWLRRRLAESHLVVPPPLSPLEPAGPSPSLVGAAALLASAPQGEAALAAACARALSAAGLDSRVEPNQRSQLLIGVLREMGWLESRGTNLATAHDVVADEVVRDVLVERSAAAVRTRELGALLAPALSSARTLGRLAIALRRVLGMEGLPEGAARQLLTASAAWLEEKATELGRLLPLAEPNEAAFALGDVVQGVPWGEASLYSWDHLFTPFLQRHAEHLAMRHLLYRGLSALPEGRGALLFPGALRWLDRHGLLPEASFVLGPLLRRDDLDETVAATAIVSAVAWFEANVNQAQADFVFNALLERHELDDDVRRWVARLGVEWLRHAPPRDDRDFALKRLLWNAGRLDEADRHFLAHDLTRWLAAAPRSGDTVERLQLALQRLSQQHPEESWIAETEQARTPLCLQIVRDLGELLRNPAAFNAGDLLHRAREEAARLLDGEHPGAAGHLLSSSLPLVGRVGEPTLSQHFRDLTRRVLTAPSSTPQHRFGFATACYRQLDEGAWPDPRLGERFLRGLGIERPGSNYSAVRRELNEWAADPAAQPLTEQLQAATAQAERVLDADKAVLAGYLLQCLLPLVERNGDRELSAQVRGLTARFWSAPTHTQKSRTGFAGACYQRLDAGAWPDRAAGEQLLAALGLLRPGTSGPKYVELTAELTACVRHLDCVPPAELLTTAIEEAEQSLERGNPGRATYAVEALLPLAARRGEPEMAERVRGLARRLLAAPALAGANLRGFAGACYRSLDEELGPITPQASGCWPSSA